MKALFQYTIDSFHILIREEDDKISGVSIREDTSRFTVDGIVQETPLIHKAHHQIFEYLTGERTEFNLPLLIQGTEFQQRVYHALLTIPYGKVASYKDIAQQISSPKAYRAVGNAANRNNIGIIVPCHRVIGSNGSLVGYAGGLQVKQYLLELESKRAL